MRRITVGILAHVDAGKTTLSEALMYTSGNLKKFGRVDHRDSFLDTFSQERERGITIFSKQAVLPYKETEFTLLDTPGHVDFSAETERTMQVLDYAILVISGTDGVQSHTETLWKLLSRYGVPTFIFVNKMDLPGADKHFVLSQLSGMMSEGCTDFTDREGEAFYEHLALLDDDLLSEYDRTGKVSTKGMIRAIKERKVFPVLFGSALKVFGVEEFLECFYAFAEMPQYSERFSGKVYKISEDGQKNRLTFLKVTGGELKVKEVLPNKKNTGSEKVQEIRIYSGEKYQTVPIAPAGCVCAVTGISTSLPGDGLGDEADSSLPILEPVLTYRVILPPEVDAHTALSRFRVLEAEDPKLGVEWDERTSEIRVQLMGEVQLEVLEAVVKERFSMNVSFGQGNIIYKETIQDTVEGVGHFEPLRHYAEVHLLLKPGPRDSGLTFRSECKEDLLDKNWQRLILTHLYEKTHLGVLTGAPITDMEISLVSGRAHPKHTEGGDFRQATYRAVRQGLREAKSILLEPVYEFTLTVPFESVGRAMSDVSRMYGSFLPPETVGEMSVISGTAPVSTMQDYAKDVAQYTHGSGKLFCSLKGYAPCHNAEEVIAAAGYDPDADVMNTADSVFCAHGAGFHVKWNEVKNHMHLSSALAAPRGEGEKSEPNRLLTRAKEARDSFALDKELMQIFEQTYGPVKRRETHAPVRYTAPEKSPGYRAKEKDPKYEGKEYLLVDGYNVIFSWEHLKELSDAGNMQGARDTLVNVLCNYKGYRKCEVILVFDAYKVPGNVREVEEVGGIHIVYTKEAETADMYIEKATHELAKKHHVRVVTSDGLEQLIILGGGALRVSSRAFLEEIKACEDEVRRMIAEMQQEPFDRISTLLPDEE